MQIYDDPFNEFVAAIKAEWLRAQSRLPKDRPLDLKIEMVASAAIDEFTRPDHWLALFRAINEAGTDTEDAVRLAVLKIRDRRQR
jgi:hypothetical protein